MFQKIPAAKEGVQVFVGDNFHKLAIKNLNDVLVEFVSPGCVPCNEFDVEYEKLAKRLSSVKGLVLAKIDVLLNDIPEHPVDSHPTFRFFPAKNKKNYIDYDGELEADKLLVWLRSNSKFARWSKFVDEL